MKVIIFFIVFALSGCATITRGSSESFVIETTPAGANVTLSNGLSCMTPCSLKVKRRPLLQVTIEKSGYKTIRTTVTSSVQGGGAAGMAGNVYKPNPLRVELEPEESTK